MNSERKAIKIEQIWQKAQKHRQASLIGTPSNTADYELCQCCAQVVEKEPISLCEHTKELERYGFGYPLWFSFLKCCIILMLVLIASKTANELYMGANENWDFCYGKEAMGESESSNHNSQSDSIKNQSSINSKNNTIGNQSHEDQNKFENFSSDQNTHNIPTIKQDQLKTYPVSLNQEHAKKVGSSSAHSQNSKPKCTSFMVFLSIFKGEKMYENYFLKGVQFCIHLIALIAIRNMILKQEQYYDERTTLISKYSIIIHNLPNVYNLKRKVADMLQQQFGCFYGDGDSEIKDLIYVFKDQAMTRLSSQKQMFQEQIIKAEAQQDENAQNELKKQLQLVNDSLQRHINHIRKQISNGMIICNKMIVIMRTEGDKASALYFFKEALKQKKNFNSYFYDVDQIADEVSFKPTEIFMKQAPQPNEIIWEHLDESDHERKMRIVQGYVFTFLFLAVITVVFYFVMLAKTSLFLSALEMQENDPTNLKVGSFKAFATFIVFVALFGVVLFNKFVMGNVLHKFVHMEHHAYTDKESHSFALKYAIGMFFTTALMTIAVQALTYNNFYTHPYGVIEQETIMFFVTAFILPIIWWIHPYNLIKNIRRKKNQGKMVTQKQANQIVEHFPYMLGKRYAQIFEIMWFTFLYSQLIPMGSFLMLIGLMLYYWVDKYNFLRKSAVKQRVSGKMAILGLKSLDATLFLSPAGELLFGALLRDQFDYPALIFVFIGVIYTLLPVTSFIWELNGEKFLIEEKTYEQSCKKFKETYYSLHPIYKLTHKDQIEKNRAIVQEFYKDDLKKVKHFGTGRGNYKRETTILSRRNTDIESENLRL